MHVVGQDGHGRTVRGRGEAGGAASAHGAEWNNMGRCDGKDWSGRTHTRDIIEGTRWLNLLEWPGPCQAVFLHVLGRLSCGGVPVAHGVACVEDSLAEQCRVGVRPCRGGQGRGRARLAQPDTTRHSPQREKVGGLDVSDGIAPLRSHRPVRSCNQRILWGWKGMGSMQCDEGYLSRPGAMRRAMSAPSMAMVPLPHIGSHSTWVSGS